MVKKIGIIALAVLLGLGIWQHELVSYGWMQARGQLRIIANTEPVETVLANPTVPDSVKRKIELIQEIKRFAFDSVGLNPSESYSTYYDQGGKPILWVITAAPPYDLKAKEWSFPILGTFSYKGFFERARADSAVTQLKRSGYDTRVGEVSAWSTLGFLKDPILSSMTERDPGSLAELIIHELTHGTLFVKNSLEYNENLADFVGEYGALRFLAHRYGRNSREYTEYLESKAFSDRYDEHVLRGARKLDSLYRSFKPATPIEVKEERKWAMIGEIVQSVDTLSKQPLRRKRRWSKLNLPNNAYFVGYLTYRKQQNRFRQEFEQQFGSNFGRYLSYLKQTYPSL
ncbi:aminopeptidase [Rudanella paleaurantiibacter]|uniref:Aminopeptidase n=1 Tax=Rudanella paleaurantiibacter TaxID=2614655 RepID=A0A7J5TZ15_9BACT|nr:aminopeptidase [Rudanella paleaurantiibacter]KAB7730374.1 aminopeptidase [Rudanella paleaurantiibacter]